MAHGKVRGQHSRVGSLLPPSHGYQGSSSGCHTYTSNSLAQRPYRCPMTVVLLQTCRTVSISTRRIFKALQMHRNYAYDDLVRFQCIITTGTSLLTQNLVCRISALESNCVSQQIPGPCIRYSESKSQQEARVDGTGLYYWHWEDRDRWIFVNLKPV